MSAASPVVGGAATARAEDVAPDISFRVRFTWGIGSLGTITYLNIVTALVLVYLTTILKIPVGIAGTMLSAARIIDAFSDPFMGRITDHTRTRWGRRRPYLLLGAFVCGLALPLVYSQHNLDFFGSPALLAFAVLVFYSLGFTIFNVPYLAMPVEMTKDRMQRLSVMGYRSVFMMFGSVVGSAGGPWLVGQLGRDAEAFQTLGYVGGAFVFLAMLITFLGTRTAHAERVDEVEARVPFIEQVRAVLDNGPFMAMVGIKVLQFIALSSAGGTTAFFVIMVLKKELTLMSLLAVATIASTVLFIPFFRWLGRYITKRRGLAIGIVGEIFAQLTWLAATPDDSVTFFVLRGVLAGIFSSAILLYGQAMWLDTIDYDRQKTGKRREGVYTSIYVFVERLGYSLGPLFLTGLLAAMNFDSKLPLEKQPPSAELAVMLSLVAIPSVAYGLGLVFLWFYRLPEQLDDRATA
jgi:GPH family glycoside/pentoside/hexuronide:cation symporter